MAEPVMDGTDEVSCQMFLLEMGREVNHDKQEQWLDGRPQPRSLGAPITQLQPTRRD